MFGGLIAHVSKFRLEIGVSVKLIQVPSIYLTFEALTFPAEAGNFDPTVAFFKQEQKCFQGRRIVLYGMEPRIIDQIW